MSGRVKKMGFGTERFSSNAATARVSTDPVQSSEAEKAIYSCRNLRYLIRRLVLLNPSLISK